MHRLVESLRRRFRYRPAGAELDAIEQAVARIEKRSDAEVVVVLAGGSGSYRDLALLVAALVSWALLVAAIAAPIDLDQDWLPIGTAVGFVAMAVVAGRPAVVRRLAPARRRRAQVALAAAAAFEQEAVHSTPNRTGILVYRSELERVTEVLPDVGIAGRIAPGALAEAIALMQGPGADPLVRGLDRLGDVLEAAVPHLADSDAFDLANRPRVRP